MKNYLSRLIVLGILFLPAMIWAASPADDPDDNSFKWINIKDLGIQGKGWEEEAHPFNRLPARARNLVREPVWGLSRHSAGLYVRFKSNATTIRANWKLTGERLAMSHMAATGVSGLDLYVRHEDGSWRWLGVGRPDSIENTVTLVEGIPDIQREYLLYLPLYNGVEHASLGIPAGQRIDALPAFPGKPIVFYGTSITQGGCASRPGMCTSSILGRRFDREFINLGFSGNGRMEPEMATLLAELDPAVYFIDCLPNLQPEQVADRVEPFVNILRKAHPGTPIVLAEDRTYDNAFLIESKMSRNLESRKALRDAYENLLKKGTRNLYYQTADGQLGWDGEGTVDSSHPTDLGFYRQADAYQPLLASLIAKTVPGTIEEGDPPNPAEIPDYYKSKLSDIEEEVKQLKTGKARIVATSPGGLPVYAVYYGTKEQFRSEANYNSAVAARNPVHYASKSRDTRPVAFFIGPVHGQEVENIVGMVNLIHVAETGKDYRGKDWSSLKSKIEQCRVIIIPCGNPDGRRRCPYDSFVGLPTPIMTKYGQGTRKDGSLYGWPGAKAVHPMQGNVKILGAYFNDDGINPMHDEFFSPMADETAAILEIARFESPDITVSLHSHENKPRILPAHYVPWFMKERVQDLTRLLNDRYRAKGLPSIPEDWIGEPGVEDRDFPPKTSFNLISALHHISGTMAFTFECSHGTVSERFPEPFVGHSDILDIQLHLYEQMLDYLLENRLYWQEQNN